MSSSETLLLVAVLTAALPIISTRLRPPTSIRELEKSFVVAVATLGLGALIVSQTHSFGWFALAHLTYLVLVVTIPLLLGGWYVTAYIRRRRTRLLRIGALVAVVVALFGVWGTHIEPNWLETDVVAVTAPVRQPLTIGVLADLQTPNIGKHEWNAINTLIAEEPDMVLVPGDLFQGDPETIAQATPDFIELLSALTANVEVVAVVSGDSDRPVGLIPIVEAAGAIYIDNQITDITVRGQPIRLAGVTVFAANSRLDTIAELGVPSDSFTILLAHRPDVVFDLPLGTDVDLIVSGHTHGGQVALPFFGPLVTFSDVPRALAAGGIGVVDNYPIYVSTGVGLERLDAPQVRFGVRPSVGIIEVVPQTAG